MPMVFLTALLSVNSAAMLAFDSATKPVGVYHLDFTGGVVFIPQAYPIPTQATLQVPPFCPLGSDADATERIVKLVLENVRRDFYRWPGIEIRRGESHDLSDANVVLVGGWAAVAGNLGIASAVDTGDRSSDDRAVVYSGNVVDTLTGGLRFVPSEGAIAQAVANVVSHEIGHLLGFSHVAGGSLEIMSPGLSTEAAAADQMFRHHHQSYVDRRFLWCGTR